MVTITSDLSKPPSRYDLEANRPLLLKLMEAFGKRPPRCSDLEKGFIALDEYYRRSLSKTTKKRKQKSWASIDAVTTRWILQYIFSAVRTQGGNQNARYATLSELKALVNSPAAKRRSLERDVDSKPPKNNPTDVLLRLEAGSGAYPGLGPTRVRGPILIIKSPGVWPCPGPDS